MQNAVEGLAGPDFPQAVPTHVLVQRLTAAIAESNGLEFVTSVDLLELRMLISDELRDRNIR